MMELLGRLLGMPDLAAVHSWKLRFTAGWAENRPALVLFACLALAAAAVLFYVRRQRTDRWSIRAVLVALRTLALVLLLLCLAEPVVALAVTRYPKPLLLCLFDATDSMNISDRLSPDEKKQLGKVVSFPASTGNAERAKGDLPRIELVRHYLTDRRGQALRQLARKNRLRFYVLDRPDQVRPIELGNDDDDAFDADALASQLAASGQVTAIGAALDDLAQRHQGHNLAGVLVFSDFDQNAGPPALPAARRLEAPIYSVGLGPRQVVDLAVDLQAPLIVKKGEKVGITARLRQSGLTDRSGDVQLLLRRLGSTVDEGPQAAPAPVGSARAFTLKPEQSSVEVPFTPDFAGRFLLQAKATAFEDEVLEENNTAEREIIVRDEALKLLFVENEPTWEWRFIKEVFHRDPLVGREGFRTFLRSADFKVRSTNPLFLETLVRPRSEFFAYDVIFISDVPAEMLSEHFQEMLREYVGQFGGGLVVISGPRYGPQVLANTKLGEMLPVIVDANAQIRDVPFEPKRTPFARQYDFMNLGSTETENERAWAALGRLPWYQPVARPHPLATVLAQHPSDRCVDAATPQPLVAVRRYGKGEVVWFAFNETWRLRRKFGETYYRQLWGQMMYHLGLARALGEQKRFMAATDRRQYQAGEKVRLTVEAYNRDFEALGTPSLAGRLMPAAAGTQAPAPVDLTIPLARGKNIYEVVFPVFTEGPHRLLVRDPVTQQEVEVNFRVAPVTAERRSAVRDLALQTALAEQTGGKALELYELDQLPALIKAPVKVETSERHFPLWNTWLFLTLGLALMLGEWLIRKLVNLP